MPISQFASADVPPMDSPFYRMERPKPATYKRGDYGPPVDGVEYREKYYDGEWRKPDGSRAAMGSGAMHGFGVAPVTFEIRPILTWVALAGAVMAFASNKYRAVALTALGGSAAFLIATK